MEKKVCGLHLNVLVERFRKQGLTVVDWVYTGDRSIPCEVCAELYPSGHGKLLNRGRFTLNWEEKPSVDA
ncbi:MAG: hypothetical protein ABSF44_16210 [Candidatus Bathyarchaeia archaeon]|jgi:hypothetical protein